MPSPCLLYTSILSYTRDQIVSSDIIGNPHTSISVSYTPLDVYKRQGIWTETDAYTPKVGDACVYDWQDGANYATTDNTGAPDHIGIVTKVGGGTFVVTRCV